MCSPESPASCGAVTVPPDAGPDGSTGAAFDCLHEDDGLCYDYSGLPMTDDGGLEANCQASGGEVVGSRPAGAVGCCEDIPASGFTYSFCSYGGSGSSACMVVGGRWVPM